MTFFEVISIAGLGYSHPNGIQSTKEMLNYAGLRKSDFVLDIGCGIGKTACYVSKRIGCKVIGADISKDMIFKAKKTTKSVNLNKKVEFIAADLHNLPFEDNSCDCIILESVMIYVNKDKAINELKRVLKPDGKICATEFTWLQRPNISLVNKTSEILNTPVEILMIDEWKTLLQNHHLIPIMIKNYNYKMNFLYQIRRLFPQGLEAFNIIYKSLTNANILKKILEIKNHFSKNSDYFGYSTIIVKNEKL